MSNKSMPQAGVRARSLVQRLTRTFLTWMAAAYVLSLAGLWWSAHYVVESNLNKELLQIAAELDAMGAPLFFADQSQALERVHAYAAKNPNIMFVHYYRADDQQILGRYSKYGKKIASEPPAEILETLRQPDFAQTVALSTHRIGVLSAMRGVAPIRTRSLKDEQMLDMSSLNNRQDEQTKTIGYLDVGIDIAPSRAIIIKSVAIAAGVSSLLLLLALLLGRRHVRKSLDSLLQLQEPLRQLANGNFNVAVEHDARDLEIATICEAVNKTIEALRLRNAEIEDALRAKLEAQAASEAKNQFLAHMSHEIRTPLNGIMGFLKLLTKTTLTATQREYLHTTEVSAKTLLTVINDILDFSKIEAGKISMEQLDIELRELLDEVMSLHAANAEDKRIDLVFIYSKSVPTRLLGDPARISQVLSNLVGNAIKFTPHGEVLVTVDLREESATEVLVALSVQDTGIGIPAEALERLFQPFSQADASTTRKYGGSGLGLIISKRLVELMGGRIAVESQVGKGTCFTITLRLPKQASAVISMPMGDIMAAQRILTVTPSTMVARSLSENLASWEIESDTAGSAEAALRMLQQANQCQRPYGVIIYDQGVKDMMPRAFVQSIRAANAGATPLLLLSGLSGSLRPEDAQHYGFASVVSKPAKSSELFNELTKILIGAKKIAAERDAVASAAELRLERDGRPVRVLIVDDNEINRKLAKILIEQRGGETDLAEDGAQAVDACHLAMYDLVLMDVHMPVMDGIEATTRIREMELGKRHTLIVALTANAMSGDRERYLAAGMDDYLGKPINEKLFIATLQKFGLTRETSLAETSVQADAELTVAANAAPLPSPDDNDPAGMPLPILDPQLGVELAFGERDTWRSMLGILFEQLPADAHSLQIEKIADNLDNLLQIAHRIAGAASYCGTPALHHQAKLLENLIKRGEAEAAMVAVDALSRQIARLLALQKDGKLPDGSAQIF